MSKIDKTILGNLVEEKNTKIVIVKAKVSNETKLKIKTICNKYDVKEDEYLGKILESSEIDKVFNSIQKETVKTNQDSEIKHEENHE